MAPRTVHFDDDELYIQNRPYIDVVLYGPGGPQGYTSISIAMLLVDTGADFTQLDLAAARHVGLDPPRQGMLVQVATAGGLVQLHQMPVDIDVIGQRVTVRAQFGPSAAPLYGREGIFQAMEQVGFTTQDWLQKLYPASTGSSAGGTESLSADEEVALKLILRDPRAGDRGAWVYPLHHALTRLGWSEIRATVVLNTLALKGILQAREVETEEFPTGKRSRAPVYRVTPRGFEVARRKAFDKFDND